MRINTTIDRRDFIKGSSLAFACMFVPGGYAIATAKEMKAGNEHAPFVWFTLNQDDTVTVFTNKSEMGQGIHTGIALIIADELDVDMEKVIVVPAPVTNDYVDPYFKMHLTGGSTSLRNMYAPLRQAAASAREMLIQAAATVWKVPVDTCKADLGKITHKSGKSFTYSQLADAAGKLKRPASPVLKKPADYRYMGKEFKRIDMAEKSTGQAKFALDIHPEGAYYATVIKAPRMKAGFESIDEKTLAKVEGFIKTIPLQDGVALVAKTMEGTLEAKNQANAKFDDGILPDTDNSVIYKDLTAHLAQKGDVAANQGNSLKNLDASNARVTADYHLPYLHHMLMEPLSCVADVKADSCVIWSGTQNQTACMMAAKNITGLKEEQIDIRTTYLGTGLGRRAHADFVADALMISKSVGHPVKLMYDRETEIRTSRMRPANVHHIQTGIKDGYINGWNHKLSCSPIMKVSGFGSPEGVDHTSVEGIADTIYSFDALNVEVVDFNEPIPIWFWRSVGNSQNAFVMETMMDELAYMAGEDPVVFRLRHLKNQPRAKKLLETVAQMSNWNEKPSMGQAKGCAIHYCFGSYVAEVAEISLDQKSGQIRVDKVSCAIDMGPFTVHPDSVVAQMEGAIIMGISAALYEEVNIEHGGITNSNYHDYPIARMSDAPTEINVKIINSEGKPGGIGEPALPPIAPAIANAFYKLTNMRVRTLPLKPDKVLKALKSGEKFFA